MVGPVSPDIPSLADVRQFLLTRNQRTVTVGRFFLWVWDKSEATLDAVRKLATWEQRNLVRLSRRLLDWGTPGWEAEVFRQGLAHLGVKVPKTLKAWAEVWPDELRHRLGLTVTILERRTPDELYGLESPTAKLEAANAPEGHLG